MALKVTKNVRVKNIQGIYTKYNVSDKIIKEFEELIESDGAEYALDLFIAKYMIEPAQEYNILMEEFLDIAEEGELTKQDKQKVEKNISLLTFGLSALLVANFTKLVKDLYSESIFTTNKIKTKKVQRAILDATLGQFESLTSKSLLSTQTDILKNIRNMQKEMIIFNQGKGRFLKGTALSQEITRFKDLLKKRHPEYYKLKDGKLIGTKPYGPKNTVRQYKLDDYLEMSTRTTLLNINRASVQISVLNKEAKKKYPVNVVEYALIDDRPLKTGIEREICKTILKTKPYGVPLLALDEATGAKLGIMTLDDAVSQGSQGPHCRHGILPISRSTRKKLEKVVKTDE